MGIGGFMLIIGGGVLFVVGAILLYRVFSSGSTGRKAPILKVPATVLGKRFDEVTRGSSAMGTITTTKYYYITFDLGNGDTIELLADKETFQDDNVGKSGILTYKGTKFLGFIKDN